MTTSFLPIDRAVIAREAAKMLLEIKAVHFYQDTPFTFTSGWASPVYIDCRKIISYPRLRSTLNDFAAATIVRDIGYESITHVAGGETAGIPFAAWISDRLMLPMQYVRKKAKGFGRNAQIEGEVVRGRENPAGGGSGHRRAQQGDVLQGAARCGCAGGPLLRDVLLRHLPQQP